MIVKPCAPGAVPAAAAAPSAPGTTPVTASATAPPAATSRHLVTPCHATNRPTALLTHIQAPVTHGSAQQTLGP